MFGLGIAVALLYRQRRPLHDVVFRTAVVTTRAEARRSLRERLEEFDRRLQDRAEEVSWPRRPLTRVGKWIVTGLLALSAGRSMVQRWLLRGSRSAAPQTSGGTAATTPSTAATLGILAVTTIISTAIWLQVPESTWFGDDDPDEVVVAGGPTGPSTTTSEPAPDPGVDLASLRSAPVPPMCDNPAGTMTDGAFQPATGGETSLVENTLFASAGWSTTGVGDLTGDGVDEGVAVLVCFFPDGGNAFETLAVVYRTGPTIVTTMPFDGLMTARIDDGAVDLVGLTGDGQDARCCPSVVTARSFRLEGDQLVDAERDLVTIEDEVSPGAWGDLPVPSSYADTALALGEPVDVADGLEENAVSFSPDTYQCQVTSGVGGSDFYFLGVSDQTAILYVLNSAIRTSEGIGIGSTADEVRAAYGAELFEAANEYSDIPDLYVGDPAMTEGTPGIRFVLDQTTMTVTVMMVGEFTSIMAAEGCT